MDMIMDVIESNCYHACMHTMRTLYARDADAICTRHDIRPPGGATLGGLREMQRSYWPCTVAAQERARAAETDAGHGVIYETPFSVQVRLK